MGKLFLTGESRAKHKATPMQETTQPPCSGTYGERTPQETEPVGFRIPVEAGIPGPQSFSKGTRDLVPFLHALRL